jgi:phosphoribosylamine--glycine ligase
MNVLVLGSGGREHAIVWKMSQSKLVDKIFAIPGNSGISEFAECLDGNMLDFEFLENIVNDKKIELIIPGPEAPLVAGIADYFKNSKNKNILVFAPDKKSARLEGSKCFTKEILEKYKIPTAEFGNFDNKVEALKFVEYLVKKNGYPVVIKADGLAGGKGVIIAQNQTEVEKTIDDIITKKIFGDAGKNLVIEEFLKGYEVSLHLVVSGSSYKLLPFSQDHKQIFDGDKGPNTGGMGAYSPCPLVDKNFEKIIERDIIKPLLSGFENEDICYKGILYIGLMICNGKPFVLELNVRFGDPETQVLLPIIENDLAEIAIATVNGELDKIDIKIKNKVAVAITCSAKGYPNDYEKGKTINGIDTFKAENDIFIFQCGTTKLNDGTLITNGGRVLSFVAFDTTLKSAIAKAYKNISKINFEGMHYRRDIGQRKELGDFR